RFGGFAVIEVAICTCVEPGPAENVICILERSNWHISSPKRWMQEDCHSRRGIWIFNNSRCERHLISTWVRVHSISEIRPAKGPTFPGLVPPYFAIKARPS